MDYHVKRLVLKAMNNSRTNVKAAIKLGVTEKTLYNYVKKFNIEYNKKTHEYEENIPRGSSSVKV